MSGSTPVETAPTYARDLSRALWFRQPATRNRFVFAADDPEGLTLAPLSPKGTQAIIAAAKRLAAAGRKAVSGAMLVDSDGDSVFCADEDPAAFLARLSAWCAQHVGAVPALATLTTAGAARLAGRLGGDDTIEALQLDQLEIVRDPALWTDVLAADHASVAAVLAERVAGERMWFWMSNDVPGDMVPLLVQPVAWDPNRDRLDGQIRQLETLGAGDGVTGYALFTEEGRLQFVSAALDPVLMAELADWVSEQMGAHPALARLARCQFVVVSAGKVVAVLEDDALWGSLAPPASGTLVDPVPVTEPA